MKKTNDILKEFRAEIEKLYGKRLINVILYGSFARGEATEGSDIDLVVILEGEVKTRERDRPHDRYYYGHKPETWGFNIGLSSL